MIKNNFKFTSLKNSKLSQILNSINEESVKYSFKDIILKKKIINNFFFKYYSEMIKNREQANSVIKDLIGLISSWRQIRGYPSDGSTTHTNAKTSRKNKLLLSYRLNQFFKIFGNKKRNIYPTLIKAEYNNRLWYTNWFSEWIQAHKFAIKMLNIPNKMGGFNPALLATNQTNGYIRVGKASKIGKAKKITKAFTIGVPVFFTRFIYYERLPKNFLYRLTLKDEVNKKMGKRIKKKNKCYN